jgi:two-component system sensor histidine kinase/response regulator
VKSESSDSVLNSHANSAIEDPPKSLLLLAGLTIILVEPVWLIIEAASCRHSLLSILKGFGLFNMLLGSGFLSLVYVPKLRVRWRSITLLLWTLLILSGAITTRLTAQLEPFVELLLCVLLINSMLCGCSHLWLGCLSGVSVVAFVWLSSQVPATPIQWFAVMVAVGLAHAGLEVSARERHKTALARAELESKMIELEAAQQRASQSEDNLKKLILYAPDVIAVNRYSDGRFIFVNQEFDKHFSLGQGLEDIPVQNLVPHVLIRRVLRKLKEHGVVRDIEFDYRTNDGTLHHYLISSVLAEVNSEKCVVTFAREITAIKQIEQKLRDSGAMMRKIFDENSDPMTVVDASSNVFVDANLAHLRFHGVKSRQDVIGVPPSRFVPREILIRINQMLARDGQIMNHLFEFPDKDGRLVPMLLSICPMELGGKLHYVTTAREITAIKDMERKLRERERMLRRIFEASPHCITIARLSDGTFKAVNDGFVSVFGYTREEAINRTQRELNLWGDLPQARELMRRLRTDGVIRNRELNTRRKDGTIVPCLVSAAVTEIGSELCAVAFLHDISALKRVERDLVLAREAALAASKAKSEFLSTMSHEIRTPLNVVLGVAELLAETELSEEQRRYLETMVAAGNALLELINNILDLAKIEAGRMQVESTEFDLPELIEKTISTFAVRAHGKGLELVARIEPGVPDRLTGDPLRLRQILVNLLGNAVKFTEIGQIVLQVSRTPGADCAGHLTFSVADTGIGIAGDKLPHIFSTFTQADSSTTRRYGGSGLGLTIVRRLTELMGGQIAVESELGKGSKFSFSAEFGLVPRIIRSDTSLVLSLVGYRVLVVDDNQLNRLIAREMLAECGATVDEAASGEEAVEMVRKEGRPYHLILLDMRMPGIDGLETVRRIRAAYLHSQPIVLMLSSDDLKPQLARLRALQLDDYLVKPVTRRELFGAIRRVLPNTGRAGTARLPTCQAGDAIDKRTVSAIRILLAEDAPDNRMLMQAYLRREPHQIDLAENGRVAVDKYMANPYDLVFMDVQMPELDGLEATRLIREWERKKGVPPATIIALTASALEEDVTRSLEAGCTAHISKPVKKETILNMIRTVSNNAPRAVPIPSAASTANFAPRDFGA